MNRSNKQIRLPSHAIPVVRETELPRDIEPHYLASCATVLMIQDVEVASKAERRAMAMNGYSGPDLLLDTLSHQVNRGQNKDGCGCVKSLVLEAPRRCVTGKTTCRCDIFKVQTS